MDILSDKIVTTRKKHNCSACGRIFEAGSKMRTQVNTSDGLQTFRLCETCDKLLSKYRDWFEDNDGICWANCVDECLTGDQTPEEFLDYLNNLQPTRRTGE